jgi:hypothetical protein
MLTASLAKARLASQILPTKPVKVFYAQFYWMTVNEQQSLDEI